MNDKISIPDFTIAWTGGSRPNKPSKLNTREFLLIDKLFREQMSFYTEYWGEYPNKDTRKIFYNRARYDAHATLR